MKLDYILIGSPDKITLNTFIRFLKRSLGNDFITGEMHSLMSSESKSIYVEDFIKKFPKGIFSYYAKGIKQGTPVTFLPESAIKISDIIVWFDLYSTIPVVIKDSEGFLPPIIENWNKYVETLNS
jgi:hypothetical protein